MPWYNRGMHSRWSDEEAETFVRRYADGPHCNEDVALRVYSSRLIGREPTLVLHGGGNTSVKTQLRDDTGALVDVLCVKGSGWDLAAIEPAGLPAVRLATLSALRQLDALSDEDMVNAQRTRLLDASAPNPSVETLLHAFLPARYIDHSHADAILALVDQPRAEAICAELFGDRLVTVPYVMPGFALAKLAAEIADAHPEAEGLLLLQHGLFTWGASARESYERHVAAVDRAERHLAAARSQPAGRLAGSASTELVSDQVSDRAGKQVVQPAAEQATHRVLESVPESVSERLADTAVGAAVDPVAASVRDPARSYASWAPLLRGRLATGEGSAAPRRMVFELRTSAAISAFLAGPELGELSQRGPVTPDHVIRTKAKPLVLDLRAHAHAELAGVITVELERYRSAYRAYVARQVARRNRQITALDPEPRVLLLRGVGLVGVGPTPKAARIAADLYEHTIDVITAAEAIGRYQALPESDLFDMEYWSLEQAKLGRARPARLAGRIVYLTGAARGIGAATARAFAREGASLYLVDREPDALAALGEELGAASEALDVGDRQAVLRSLENCVLTYGGLDGVISNAGFAPQSAIASCPATLLERSFAVNFFAHQWIAAAAWDIFAAQGIGGFLLFNASKAAFNPGAGFGPYAVPKAALVALMKQYALEGGALAIRSNAVNADRVRTDLLDHEQVAARAQARGLAVDDYYRSNLLAREVRCEDVAEAFVHLAVAEATTGSVLTVDGGNIAASPR